MSSGAAKPDSYRGRPDLGRVGRKLGIAVFWLLLLYMVGMSALSIIPSLFWPDLAPRPKSVGLERCARDLDTLDRELLAHAAQTIRGEEGTQNEQWFSAWDARFTALGGGCGPLDPARRDLDRLRTNLKAMLRSYRGGPYQTQQQIRRALDQVQALRGSARPKG